MSGKQPTTKKKPIIINKRTFANGDENKKNNKTNESTSSTTIESTKGQSEDQNQNQQQVVRVKRKREEQPLEAFIVNEPPPKKVSGWKQLDEALKNLDISGKENKTTEESNSTKTTATTSTTSSSSKTTSTKKSNDNNGDSVSQRIQEKRLYRLAYTITDSSKIKQNMKQTHKIVAQENRQKQAWEKRKATNNNTDNNTEISSSPPTTEDANYVIDVYVRDTQPKPADIDDVATVKLETFNEDLVLDNEYDLSDEEQYDSEDSNAEGYYKNDYPDDDDMKEEVLRDAFSDDESDGEKNVNNELEEEEEEESEVNSDSERSNDDNDGGFGISYKKATTKHDYLDSDEEPVDSEEEEDMIYGGGSRGRERYNNYAYDEGDNSD